jgi:uncharacterized membrane protein YgcG
MLATSSGEARFDFSGRKDLYTAYIPWAVAFGCADEWAKKYRTETGETPPLPGYAAAGVGGASSITPAAMTASFGAAVGAAIGAYSASISTSSSSSSSGSSFSSSGGGFSGGGGGGGGGGGSW